MSAIELNGSGLQLGATGPTTEEPATKAKARNVKTPLQKEVLEASYQLNPNPNQQFRRTLAERIGLTEEQVNSWFSTRRRKDKPKTDGAAGQGSGSALASPTATQIVSPQAAASTGLGVQAIAAAAVPSTDASGFAAGYASGYDSEAGGPAGGSSMGASAGANTVGTGAGGSSSKPRKAATPATGSTDIISAELLEAAKKALPVTYRKDGPPLSFVFDSVPAPNSKKGMQAAALIAAKRKKSMGPEAAAVPSVAPVAPAVAPGAAVPSAAAATAPAAAGDAAEQGPAKRPRLGPETVAAPDLAAAHQAHQEAVQQLAAMHATSTQAPSTRDIMKAERERQREEARKAKEMEKARAAQERENKKREAQMEKEKKAEEKRKAAEDRRREKELAKALLQQERAVGRKGRGVAEGGPIHHHHGPPDDLDLEMEALLVRARATAAAQAAARGLDPSAVDPVVPPRPEFPPPYLMMQPAFPPELEGELGTGLIEAWGFTTGFCDMLGVPTFSTEALLSALLQGSSSPLLGLVHIILLRQAQADMEEAHATGVLQSPQPHLMDKGLIAAAQRLESAWAWGLDPDLWRAHLGPLSWPEVLRQTAIAGGAGGSRVPIKQHHPDGALDGAEIGLGSGRRGKKFRAPKGAVGFEGEDVASGWVGDGPLKLQLPARFGEGTWMAAAWRVLAVAGPEGLPVPEVVRQIAIHGYRNLGTSKNPEASVTGALSRDILFVRLKPGTYALQSIATYHQRMQAAGKTPVVEAPQGTPLPALSGAAMDVDGHHEEDSDDEDESDDEEVIARAPEDPIDAESWVTTLKHNSYDTLPLAQRLEALLWLISIVVDGPGVRMRLEAREREVAALKKQLQEDSRAEKKRRQDDAAARAKAAAEQAQQRLEDLQRAAAAGENVTPEAMAAAEAAARALTAAVGGTPGSAAVATSRAATPAPPAVASSTPTCAPGQQQQQQHEGASSMQEDQQQQQQPASGAPTPQPSPPPQSQQQQDSSIHHQRQQDQDAQPSQSHTSAAATPPPQQQQLTEQQQEELKQKQDQQAAQRAELEAELAAESARRNARAEAISRCEELNVLRLEPLGMDRRSNKYWHLVCPDFTITSTYSGSSTDFDDSSKHGVDVDSNMGRIFVEYGDGSRWRVISRTQQLDQLKQVLEPRGCREGVLHQSLLRVEKQIRAAMPAAPLAMPKTLVEQPLEIQQQAQQSTQQWLQNSHQLIATALGSRSQEDAIQAALTAQEQQEQSMSEAAVMQLKCDMLRVETLLAEQLQATTGFDHLAWVQSVRSASDLISLRECLAQLEAALTLEGQDSEHIKTKKTRGQIKADAGRIPLLSPAWKVLQDTPCVKGAWLVCGAEVAAAQLNFQGLLAPVLPALPAAAAAEAGEGDTPGPEAAPVAKDPPAAAAAVADPGKLDQRHEEMIQQQRQQRQGLKWLPATVHALGLRLAALDAVLQYPALGADRSKLYGREVMCSYRYITKPAPIYAPATLDQLLSQEKVVATRALPLPEQQHQQRSASSPPEDDKQQQQQSPGIKSEQRSEQQEAAAEPAEQQQGKSHLQLEKSEQQQQQEEKQQQEAKQQQQLSNVPTLQSALSKRLRCAYGYSLAGRGLLQLIREPWPPYPDWTQQARLEEFNIPVSAYQATVAAAKADGTINMTKQEIADAKAAEAARRQAEAAARAAERAAKAEAARQAAERAAAAAAAQAEQPPAATAPAAEGKVLPPKGKVKIKLGGKAAAAVAAAKAGKVAAAGDRVHEKHGAVTGSSNGPAAAAAPKLRIKAKGSGIKGADSSREPSRENSPAPAPPTADRLPAGRHKGAGKASEGLTKGGTAAGGSKKLTGRLRLHHAKKIEDQPEQKGDDEQLLDSSEDDD